MTEREVRDYLNEILPNLADLADKWEADDLGEVAFSLRLAAAKASQHRKNEGCGEGDFAA